MPNPELNKIKLNNTEMDMPVGVKYEIVNTLPASGEVGTIYFVQKPNGTTGDLYDEYVWLDNDFEKISNGGNLGTGSFNLNGTYNASDYGYDGWDQITIAVPVDRTPRRDIVTEFDVQYVFDNYEWETVVEQVIE